MMTALVRRLMPETAGFFEFILAVAAIALATETTILWLMG
jgi:hypothetical protein